MSFDVNIGRAQPVIKAAASMNNDGGSGGNTGYMMRGKKKKEEFSRSLFGDDTEIDSFEMISKLPKADKDIPPMKPSWIENWMDKLIK